MFVCRVPIVTFVDGTVDLLEYQDPFEINYLDNVWRVCLVYLRRSSCIFHPTQQHCAPQAAFQNQHAERSLGAEETANLQQQFDAAIREKDQQLAASDDRHEELHRANEALNADMARCVCNMVIACYSASLTFATCH